MEEQAEVPGHHLKDTKPDRPCPPFTSSQVALLGMVPCNKLSLGNCIKVKLQHQCATVTFSPRHKLLHLQVLSVLCASSLVPGQMLT